MERQIQNVIDKSVFAAVEIKYVRKEANTGGFKIW